MRGWYQQLYFPTSPTLLLLFRFCLPVGPFLRIYFQHPLLSFSFIPPRIYISSLHFLSFICYTYIHYSIQLYFNKFSLRQTKHCVIVFIIINASKIIHKCIHLGVAFVCMPLVLAQGLGTSSAHHASLFDNPLRFSQWCMHFDNFAKIYQWINLVNWHSPASIFSGPPFEVYLGCPWSISTPLFILFVVALPIIGAVRYCRPIN